MIVVAGIHLPDKETQFAALGDKLPGYQHKQENAALRLVKRWSVAVDVGANVGLMTRRLAKRFDEVLAFEPVAEARECLRENIKGLDNVHIHPFGLGVGTHSNIMRRFPHKIGSSYVCDDPSLVDYGAQNSTVTEKVQIRSLDSYNVMALDFIKIDVQGFELSVLIGARDTLLRHHPVILIEEKGIPGEHSTKSQRGGLPGVSVIVVRKFLEALGAKAGERVEADRIYTW